MKSTDEKARKFLALFTGFLAVNIGWSIFDSSSSGAASEMSRAATSVAIYGTLLYFLWRRSRGVRVFLGIVQIAAPVIFLLSEVLSAYRMDISTHVRMIGAIAFGIALLFWRPVRDYTKKKPNRVGGGN